MSYERVDDSGEAAIGCGILSAILSMSTSPFVRSVDCDPAQTGADAVMYVRMTGDVILRLHVDEVRQVPDPDEEPF